MKLPQMITGAAACAALLFTSTAAHAVTYADSTTDLHNGSPSGDDFTGFQHLNITSVDVVNDATTITFSITLNADITTATGTDWGNYAIGIDSVGGGDASGNAWARPITMSSGMDYWMGSWVNSGGGVEIRSWDGGAWQLDKASYNTPPNFTPGPVVATNTLSITVLLSDLGLTLGDSFDFDVYSTGGGGSDSAVDAAGLATPSITAWSQAYDSGANVLSYTVVPEPASLGLLGLGMVAMLRRRK